MEEKRNDRNNKKIINNIFGGIIMNRRVVPGMEQSGEDALRSRDLQKKMFEVISDYCEQA